MTASPLTGRRNVLMEQTMAAANWKALVMVLVLAAFFRLWGTFETTHYMELGDEGIHVPNAISLGQYGTTDKMNWQHPQLSGLMLYGTISLFGNNPYGWRIGNVLFGTASVVLVYLIGMLLYPGSLVSLLAASLLALDPFHMYLSRTTFVEVPATFFFLMYLYLMLEYSHNRRPVLPLAGIALGLTIATKAYFIIAIPLVAGYVLNQARQKGELNPAVYFDCAVSLVLLPLSVALLSYIQWFSRGYTLPDFFQMKIDAVWSMQQIKTEEFNRFFIEAGGQPWEWFLKPLIFGQQLYTDGEKGRFLMEINNFPFRMLTFPSIIALTGYAVNKRSIKELLVPLLFGATYLLFLLVKRPMFSYSALAMLPFAYLAVARAVMLLAEWRNWGKQACATFLCCVAAWGLYTFPLISGQSVPLTLYRPILSIAKIMGTP